MKTTGHINRWFEDRNYGFIRQLGGNNQYFLHGVNVKSGIPTTGAYVRFNSYPTNKGYGASDAEVFSTRQELDHANAVDALVESTGGVE